jgi:8-oxo-dGTP diphosphatase
MSGERLPADAVFVDIGVLVTRIEYGQQEILLMKRVGGDTWHPPFGRLTAGEPIAACAKRLVKDQAKSILEDPRLRGIVDDRPGRALMVWLEGTYGGGKRLFNVVADGLTDVGWFPWNALPEPLLEPLRDLREGRGLEGPRGR